MSAPTITASAPNSTKSSDDILSDLSRRSQAESRGHGDQLGKRVCLHFAHHLTSVRLDRYFADPKLAADLLVQQTRDDQRHHLAFAWSERSVEAPQRSHFRLLAHSGATSLDGAADAAQ